MDIRKWAWIFLSVLTSANARQRWIIRALRRITGRIIDDARISELERETSLGGPVMTELAPAGPRVIYRPEARAIIRGEAERINDGAYAIALAAGFTPEQAAEVGRAWVATPAPVVPELEQYLDGVRAVTRAMLTGQ